MDLGSVLVQPIVNTIIEIVKERIGGDHEQDVEKVEEHIRTHMIEVERWSSRIQYYGMSEAELTDESTIRLDMQSIPRKFRGLQSRSVGKSEESLLGDDEHYLLLGDPGSGKTTTMKRIARKLLLEPPTSDADTYRYPIVIRLRETDRDESLYTRIAHILGLRCEIVTRNSPDGMSHSHAVDGYPLDKLVSKILNDTQALLLLDGLDEIVSQKRGTIETNIRELAYSLNKSKIILSSRSGDFVRHFDGFNIVELCPLQAEQISSIVGKWLAQPTDFLNYLTSLPYGDLADRPLFLTQLVIVFKNTGELPEQPSSVYKRIVSLVLDEWDSQRTIKRYSKYAGFTPERKIDFLAALAFKLTYFLKRKVFTSADLIDAYLSINDTFNLPSAEAEAVAKEIETHTGIVVESGGGRYEFSHLSLQEYFCAYYIVREPFSKYTKNYLKEYSAPLAIAVALSSNPSNWFAALILKEENFICFQPETIATFLSRLISEKPYFSQTPILGFAVLKLYFKFATKTSSFVNQELDRLLSFKGVKESISTSLVWYVCDPELSKKASYFLRRRFHKVDEHGFETPEGGFIDRRVLDQIVENNSPRLLKLNKKGMAVPWSLDSAGL